jgi:hypothetical protein
MKTRSIISLAFMLLGIALTTQLSAQTTAFTYHGQLNQNRQPVTGLYDMQFTIFGAETGGGAVAGPLAKNAVPVTNGLFTTRLDFMNGVFTGPARWLEISVRPAGSGNFQTLSPRQELTSSPYSIRSLTAATLPDGALTANQLHVAGVAPSAGQVLGFNGSDLIWTTSSGGGGPWSVLNNNVFYNAGKVGIGTDNPGLRLTVTGAGIYNSPSAAAFLLENTTAPRSWECHVLDDGRFQVADFSVAATRMMFDVNGNVGIGTDTPQSKLHVYEPVGSVSHLIETGGGINAWAKVAFKNLNGLWEVGTSRGYNHDVFYVDRAGTTPLEFQLAAWGGLGLGIEPQAKLHLYEPANSISHRIETGAGTNGWARVEFANLNGQWNVGTSRGYNGDQFYFHREGSPNIALGIQPNGDAFLQGTMTCKVLTITGGADIAEPFKISSAEIPKGSVVVIDEQNPGQLKLSTEAYDTRVARRC